jgi:hypothetical protein
MSIATRGRALLANFLHVESRRRSTAAGFPDTFSKRNDASGGTPWQGGRSAMMVDAEAELARHEKRLRDAGYAKPERAGHDQ